MWVLLLHTGVEVEGQKCETIKCNNDSIYFLYKELIWDRCNKLKRTLVKRDEELAYNTECASARRTVDCHCKRGGGWVSDKKMGM